MTCQPTGTQSSCRSRHVFQRPAWGSVSRSKHMAPIVSHIENDRCRRHSVTCLLKKTGGCHGVANASMIARYRSTPCMMKVTFCTCRGFPAAAGPLAAALLANACKCCSSDCKCCHTACSFNISISFMRSSASQAG